MQKNINIHKILCFMILLLFLPAQGIANQPNQKESIKNILLLHSYHKGFKWTDDITRGVASVLNAQPENIRLYIEYMDTKRIFDDIYLKKLYDLFQYKFQYLKFNTIIVSDDNAFNFMKKFHAELFPATPVVFCGVNYFMDSDIDGFENFTGVNEEADIKSVLDLALSLHPGTKKVVIINDTTTTGIKIHEKMAKIIPWYWDRVDFVLLENVEMAEIQEQVSRLAEGALVLYTIFFRDKAGNFFETDESIRLIADQCKVPIYGAWDFSLGHGIVGGMLTSGFFQGKAAAKIVLRILKGTDVRQIPVLKKSPNRYMFDYEQLKRFRIKVSDLPKESIFVNRPYSFYRQYRNLVLGTIAGITGLTIIILTLSINVIKRKRAEKELLKANLQLEFRVAERTNDLSQANQQLKTEIAERKLSEESRRESEEKYRNLVERANDGIVILQNQIIKYANPRVAQLLKKPISEIIGSDFFDYIPQKNRKWLISNYNQRIQAKNIPPIYETLILDSENRECPIEINAGIITYQREPANLVIIRDISERKKMERELLKIKRLESIGILAGGIAHDFNNILAAILGNLELSKFVSDPSHKIHTYLDEAIAASLKATNLTQKLITFSKGGMSLKRTMDVRPIISECAQLILTVTDIQYYMTMDQQLWPSNIDERRISQVLQNIFINAVEGRKNKMVVRIYASNIELPANSGIPIPNGKYIKIEIKDNGKGISPDIIGNIFDPYFSSKELGAEKGVGMGLAICHSVITNHGGHIAVESEEGKGSVFAIYLPAIDNEISFEDFTPRPHLTGTGKILVMDDEQMIRILAERILNCLGYDCVTANNGEEAIRHFSEAYRIDESFDVVILDLSVPEGMGGMETVKRLKSIDPEINVIVSSGYSSDPIMYNHQTHGFCASLPKPYSVNEMGRILKSVFATSNRKPS